MVDENNFKLCNVKTILTQQFAVLLVTRCVRLDRSNPADTVDEYGYNSPLTSFFSSSHGLYQPLACIMTSNGLPRLRATPALAGLLVRIALDPRLSEYFRHSESYRPTIGLYILGVRQLSCLVDSSIELYGVNKHAH